MRVLIIGMPSGIRHVQYPGFCLADVHDQAWDGGRNLDDSDSEPVLHDDVDLLVVAAPVFQHKANGSSNRRKVVPTLDVKMRSFPFPRKATVQVHLLRLGSKQFLPILIQRDHITIDLTLMVPGMKPLGLDGPSPECPHRLCPLLTSAFIC